MQREKFCRQAGAELLRAKAMDSVLLATLSHSVTSAVITITPSLSGPVQVVLHSRGHLELQGLLEEVLRALCQELRRDVIHRIEVLLRLVVPQVVAGVVLQRHPRLRKVPQHGSRDVDPFAS